MRLQEHVQDGMKKVAASLQITIVPLQKCCCHQAAMLNVNVVHIPGTGNDDDDDDVSSSRSKNGLLPTRGKTESVHEFTFFPFFHVRADIL
jgi:hypothetical protein